METYNDLTARLNNSLIIDYISVNPARNPIARNADRLSVIGLEYAIRQYTIFPKNIVTFLTSVRDSARIAQVHEVDRELTRNIGEELGTETGGKTHYEILVYGLSRELHVNEQRLKETKSLEATTTFVDSMNHILDGQNNLAYTIGAAYALESSAVPELAMVRNMVNQLTLRKSRHPIEDDILIDFFHRHLETWEPGHEERLRAAAATYINSAESQDLFELGFKDVMKSMDTWWNGLYKEAKSVHITLS